MVIVWRESAALLRRCLLALAGQGADQVVVSRSSEAELSDALQAEFPDVVWIEQQGVSDLPALQWSALAALRGDLAAFVEAPSMPGLGWVAAHRQAHLAHPEILASGGPVGLPPGGNAWQRGWYWSDYAAYAPDRPSGLTRDLTDANVCYKVRELRANESLLQAAAWGWRIRVASTLPSFYEPSAWIEYSCPYPLGGALRQRWSAGRAHGEVQRAGVVARVVSIATAPLLPIMLSWRGWRAARSANYLLSLPWVLVLHLCWTCGELTGLVIGRQSR